MTMPSFRFNGIKLANLTDACELFVLFGVLIYSVMNTLPKKAITHDDRYFHLASHCKWVQGLPIALLAEKSQHSLVLIKPDAQ